MIRFPPHLRKVACLCLVGLLGLSACASSEGTPYSVPEDSGSYEPVRQQPGKVAPSGTREKPAGTGQVPETPVLPTEQPPPAEQAGKVGEEATPNESGLDQLGRGDTQCPGGHCAAETGKEIPLGG